LSAPSRIAGLGIGAYYSKSDWHQPGYWDPARPHPTRNPNYDTAKEPERWASFVKFTYHIIEEIVSRYGPIDILWRDGGQVRPPQQDINMPAIATMARRHQPGLIRVDRTVGGRYENYRTPEQEVPPQVLPCAIFVGCVKRTTATKGTVRFAHPTDFTSRCMPGLPRAPSDR
jgi:alpha-L-fucosidase